MYKVKDSKIIITNLLLSLFPISYILGNSAINTNIVLFCLFSLCFFYKKIFNFKPNNLDIIISYFFLYTFFVLILNYLEAELSNKNFQSIIFYKTINYFRFFFLFFIIRILCLEKIINLKQFFLFCGYTSLFICFDIFIQFIFKKNLIGMVPQARHNSGLFGNELIAGGYLQIFSLFFLFSPIFFKKSFNKRIILQLFFFIFFTLGIILSGNRMPLILFIFSFGAYLFFVKKIRKYFYICSILFFCFMSTIFLTNKIFNINVKTFYYNAKILLISVYNYKNLSNQPLEYWQKSHITEFYCGRTIAKENFIFGGGIRYYRTYPAGCNTHPHNYYFEIVSDLGFVGLMIILFIIFKILLTIHKNHNLIKLKKNKNLNYLIPPFLIICLTEFFPIRSTGSFFGTSNSTIIFIVFAMLVTLSDKRYLLK